MRIRIVFAVCAGLVVAGLVATSAMAADLQKGISFSGPQSLRSDDNPNDYRLWGNRDYVKQSGTRWVKLWVSWYDLQQAYEPAKRAQSWAQLDRSPYLSRLDTQVRAANADGEHVLLTLYQAFPTWASGATGPDPLSTKPAIQKLPLDLSPDGPWGWLVGYLSDRYDGSSVLAGKVDALEVVNEPNLLYWPQDNIVADTATMLRTAEQLSYAYGRQAIVGPATSDYPDPGGARPGVNTDWKTFTAGLLAALAGWQPRVPFHWSQHNYRDIKYEESADPSRAKQTIDMLAAAGWPGDELWLTEGGLNLGSNWGNPAARDAQAAEIEKNFEAMRSLPEVALWVQHGINDVAGNNFKSGLRDDFNTALPGPGTERPAWSTWLSLDGARPIPPPAATASTAADEPAEQPPPTDTTVPAPTPAPSAPSVNPTTPTRSTTPASEPPATAAAAPVAGPPPIIAPISIADVAPLVESPLMPLPPCAIRAPRHLDRIHVGRHGTFTLPRTTLTARQTACRATVTLTARHQRATKTLTVDRGSSQPITIKPERIDLPAQATIRLVVQSPTPQALSWRAHLVR